MPAVNVAHLEDLLTLLDKIDDAGRLAATVRPQIERDMADARMQENHTPGGGALPVIPIRVVPKKRR
jgi:hypothetical protein